MSFVLIGLYIRLLKGGDLLLKVDPVVASGPLITTVNNPVAVVTYYGMSWMLLINLLHFGE